MPRDSGGAYTLPAGNPVAADTLIDAAWANSTLTDLGNEMSNTLHKDGRVAMTGPLVLSTRGSPLDTDAASWINIVNRIQEYFVSLAVRAFRSQTKTSGYTAALTDNTSLLIFTSSATLSLPAAATIGNGFLLFVRAGAGVTLTIDPDGTELINNLATLQLNNLGAATLLCNGVTWIALISQNPDQTSLSAPDLTRPLLRSPRERVSTTASVSGAVNISLANDNVLVWTLTGNVTLTLSSAPPSNDALAVTFVLVQDATGGRTVTWPGTVKWPGGVAPTLTTTANKLDVITLVTYDGGASYLGFVGGQNF